MDDSFRIFVEQLREGNTETIQESFSPEFLDIHEKELQFVHPVEVSGQAYLAEDSLVLHLDIRTFCKLPCSICNAMVDSEIAIKGFYHVVPLDEIKSGVYNFKNILRETILLEIPYLAECNQGNCPQRKHIEKYLKQESSSGDDDSTQDGYHPFAGLNFDEDNNKE